MKTIILSTLFIISNLFANSDDFSIIIKKKFDAALFDVTQDYDREISAIGFSYDYNLVSNSSVTYDNGFDYLSSLSSANGVNMHLVKVNKFGTITLSKKPINSKLNKAVGLVKTPENGYIVGGYTQDGMLILDKLDHNGNILFSKIFGTKNKNLLNTIISLKDGGVLTIGSSFTTRNKSNDIFTTGLGNKDTYIVRFDKNGNILWSKKYGSIYDDSGIDAVETQDGSFIVVFTTSYQNHQEVSLLRITQNGDKIWQDIIESNKSLKAHKLLLLKDNSIVLSLSQINDMQKEQIRLIKFDIYKNIILDKEITTTYSSVLKDIKEFANGNIIGVGYVKDAFDTDALSMLFDNKFTILNQEHYGDSNYDLFNALHIMHNSKIGVVGIHTSPSSQESNMWVVMLNDDATMAKKQIVVSKINSKLQNIFQDEIKAKQIIIKTPLTIELEAIYFKQGIYKLTSKQKNLLDKISKKLILFLKHNKNKILALQINGHTSSEWNGINFTTRYLKNQKLSLNRSYSVLSYIFKKQDKQTQKYLINILQGTGSSYSKRVIKSGKEDKEKSRKVTFKIILKN